MMSTKNQKVLYTVLRKISKDRQFIIDAFKNWSTDAADLRFDADDLVKYFESKLGFDANEKRNFRIAFYAISSREESALLEVPELLLKMSDQSSPIAPTEGIQEVVVVAKSNLSPQEKTFQALLEVLVDTAKNHDPEADVDLIEHFKDRKTLKSMKLSNGVQVKLTRWIEGGLNSGFQAESLDTKDMKSLFHQVYISFCESLGPVKADQVLNQTIIKVDQMNTGFSVSSLI